MFCFCNLKIMGREEWNEVGEPAVAPQKLFHGLAWQAYSCQFVGPAARTGTFDARTVRNLNDVMSRVAGSHRPIALL
jgi:hypothetical protein